MIAPVVKVLQPFLQVTGPAARVAAMMAIAKLRTPDMETVRRVAADIGVAPATVDLAFTRMIDAILGEKAK